MARVVTRTVVDRAELADWLRPRTDLLVEEESEEGVFVQGDGPFERYERRVEVGRDAPAAEAEATTVGAGSS